MLGEVLWNISQVRWAIVLFKPPVFTNFFSSSINYWEKAIKFSTVTNDILPLILSVFALCVLKFCFEGAYSLILCLSDK